MTYSKISLSKTSLAFISAACIAAACSPASTGSTGDGDGDGDGDGVTTNTPLDTNGDGIIDAVDTNGDGQPDQYGTPIDTNGDGQPDGLDTNGDGVIDVPFGTVSGDGDGDQVGDGDVGTGGISGDGDVGTGGISGDGDLGTGGAPAGSGGTMGNGSAFTCPPGSESMTLTIPGTAPTEVMGLMNQHNGFNIFEGPVWIGDALYFSNIGGSPFPSVVWKYVPGGTPEIAVNGSGSNGLAVDSAGNLVLAMHSDGSVSTRDINNLSGAATPLASTYMETRFNSPNDLVLASDGTLYFTDPDHQAMGPALPENAYIVKGGVATVVNEANSPGKPNGITLSPDESTLYIGGNNGLWRYPLGADGTPSGAASKVTGEGFDFNSVDGMGRDCAGNIYATSHNEKQVFVFDSSSSLVGVIGVPSTGGVTNVAFGGPNRTTLYITSLGNTSQIHQLELNIPGYPY